MVTPAKGQETRGRPDTQFLLEAQEISNKFSAF